MPLKKTHITRNGFLANRRKTRSFSESVLSSLLKCLTNELLTILSDDNLYPCVYLCTAVQEAPQDNDEI